MEKDKISYISTITQACADMLATKKYSKILNQKYEIKGDKLICHIDSGDLIYAIKHNPKRISSFDPLQKFDNINIIIETIIPESRNLVETEDKYYLGPGNTYEDLDNFISDSYYVTLSNNINCNN